jgi:hypothetical protein
MRDANFWFSKPKKESREQRAESRKQKAESRKQGIYGDTWGSRRSNTETYKFTKTRTYTHIHIYKYTHLLVRRMASRPSKPRKDMPLTFAPVCHALSLHWNRVMTV